MNTITISHGKVTEIKRFSARGETGADVFIRDQNDYGTVYFQVTYFGKKAESVLQDLQVDDLVNLTGTVTVNTYRKKDGALTAVLVIKNPGPMIVYNRNIMVPPRDEVINDPVDTSDRDDEYPFG